MNSAVMPNPLGSVQRAVMAHLADVSASPGSDVFDLRAVARTMGARHQPRGFARSASTGQARRPGVDGADRHRIPAILFKRLRRVRDESLPSE
jgi:hypothetical protein